MSSGATLKERPIDQQELIDLMIADQMCATYKINGHFLFRSAEIRREYEIRATALKYYLENVKWMKP